jgi:hypothetical protein
MVIAQNTWFLNGLTLIVAVFRTIPNASSIPATHKTIRTTIYDRISWDQIRGSMCFMRTIDCFDVFPSSWVKAWFGCYGTTDHKWCHQSSADRVLLTKYRPSSIIHYTSKESIWDMCCSERTRPEIASLCPRTLNVQFISALYLNCFWFFHSLTAAYTDVTKWPSIARGYILHDNCRGRQLSNMSRLSARSSRENELKRSTLSRSKNVETVITKLHGKHKYGN